MSVKAVVEVGARVPLLRNERSEWELPGGRLEAGEELTEAVEREVREELGLSVACRALVDAWTYRPGGGEGTLVIVVYDCELRSPRGAPAPQRGAQRRAVVRRRRARRGRDAGGLQALDPRR